MGQGRGLLSVGSVLGPRTARPPFPEPRPGPPKSEKCVNHYQRGRMDWKLWILASSQMTGLTLPHSDRDRAAAALGLGPVPPLPSVPLTQFIHSCLLSGHCRRQNVQMLAERRHTYHGLKPSWVQFPATGCVTWCHSIPPSDTGWECPQPRSRGGQQPTHEEAWPWRPWFCNSDRTASTCVGHSRWH